MTKKLLVGLAAASLGTVLLQAPLITAEAAPPPPTCFGQPATMVVPSTPDTATTVQGTSRDDVIVTGPGRDIVQGLGGRDLICTRGGSDEIMGGSGDDGMRGGPGNDRLDGRDGLDRANGGKGDRDVCAAEGKRQCELSG